MTKYRRKPVEVEAEYDERSGNYILERDASGMAIVFWAKGEFELEYEPVPEHPEYAADCVRTNGKLAAAEESLLLADKLAEAAPTAFSNGRSYAVCLAQDGDRKGAASVRAEVEKAEAALTAYQESRGK